MKQQTRLSHDYYLYKNGLAPYGNTKPSSVPPFTPLFSQSQIKAAGIGTNWMDLLTRPGYINDHTISISGGNQHTTVYVSFNYHVNHATLKNSNLKRYSGRINLGQDLGSFAHLNLKMTASRINSNNVSTGTNAGGPENII